MLLSTITTLAQEAPDDDGVGWLFWIFVLVILGCIAVAAIRRM